MKGPKGPILLSLKTDFEGSVTVNQYFLIIGPCSHRKIGNSALVGISNYFNILSMEERKLSNIVD